MQEKLNVTKKKSQTFEAKTLTPELTSSNKLPSLTLIQQKKKNMKQINAKTK